MPKAAAQAGLFKTQAYLLLLVGLWPWAARALATPCPEGELRPIGREEKKCCPKCIPGPEGSHECVGTEDKDCKCHPGYSCADRACLHCTKLPECAEGEELVKIGEIDFTFQCEPCKRGTYSNIKNSWCRNWTDCESSGFLTIKPGNRTHNVVCGFPVKDLMQAGNLYSYPADFTIMDICFGNDCYAPCTISRRKIIDKVLNISESLYTTILAVLTAVAVSVLIQLILFLHFCLWSLKREKHRVADSLEYNIPRLSHSPHHKEDSYSCQFPEEEHGYKTLEEKPCYFYPQNLQ